MRISVDFEKSQIVLKDFSEGSKDFIKILELLAFSPKANGIEWEAFGSIYDSALKFCIAIDENLLDGAAKNSGYKIPG